MHEKNNPWMMATFTLVGLIIGFVIGHYTPAGFLNNGSAQNANGSGVVAQNNGNNGADQNGNSNPNVNEMPQPQPEPPSTPVSIDYTSVAKNQIAQGNWTLGSKNAKVKIEEFSDFQCPFCHRFFLDTFQKLFNDYIAQGKVYYVFYNYPLNFHPQAEKAAEAALCAGDQKKYWEMHDQLFNNQDSWSGQNNAVEIFANLGQKIGLNVDTFNNCIRSGKNAKQISKDTETGNTRGVSGTPTFFINGEEIVGAQDYSEFKNKIDAALAK